MIDTIREELLAHVGVLANPARQGRVPLSQGNQVARKHVVDAFAAAGLDPVEHDIIVDTKKHGTNVIATLPAREGTTGDHFILIGAHYDHLRHSPGADDNAAAVAEMLVVARRLAASDGLQKNIVFAAFDCEEPPYFHGPAMGSTHYLANHVNPEQLDLAIILDLTGHEPRVPGLERHVFVTGAEGSRTLHELVSTHRNGLEPACIHNEHVGDMSDHHAFRQAGLPYLFLSAGYWQHYHASSDSIEHLDIDYMVQVVNWLEGLARTACTAPPGAFKGDPFDRDSFTRQEAALLSSLTGKPVNPAAVRGIIGTLKGSML